MPSVVATLMIWTMSINVCVGGVFLLTDPGPVPPWVGLYEVVLGGVGCWLVLASVFGRMMTLPRTERPA